MEGSTEGCKVNNESSADKEKSISVESRRNVSANCCKGTQRSKRDKCTLNLTPDILNWKRNVSVSPFILRVKTFRSLKFFTFACSRKQMATQKQRKRL